jgi:hypothetical protein
MSNSLESVRVIWSSTDEQFFRVTAHLFPADFVWGSGVLLASYDDADAPRVPLSPSGRTARARSQDSAPLRRTAA